MSIIVRYNPPSLTTEQYDEADRLLREAGVEPLPDGLEYHVCFGSEGNLRQALGRALAGRARPPFWLPGRTDFSTDHGRK
jgi:hypothetical protein